MEAKMKKIQIGVMGSASDIKYSIEAEKLAFEIGREIALARAALLFGIDADMDTLPTMAMRCAKSCGGTTIGIAIDRNKSVFMDDKPDIVICSGLGGDGGREYSLAVSCDAMIAIGGGSGTLK
jgi:uncharacterized protein (TIGR00725 family)